MQGDATADTDDYRNTSGTSLVWRVIGFGAFGCLLLWAMGSRCWVGTFIDPPSIAIAVGAPLSLLLAIFGWSGAREAVAVLLGRSGCQNVARSVSFFRLGAAFALAGGLLGTLIGLVIMLMNMDDPSAIGPGMAVALLTQLYGVGLAMMSCSAAAIITHRTKHAHALNEVSRESVPVAAVASAVGVVCALVTFSFMLAAMYS
ncbi:MAG TPA: MotA/TolQ/ExbB proton channel family protein [Phycisphaerae bacterium]|nr:MotA/TolQ/ExbB proton channel family protein [Phycisphaerae bacterium]